MDIGVGNRCYLNRSDQLCFVCVICMTIINAMRMIKKMPPKIVRNLLTNLTHVDVNAAAAATSSVVPGLRFTAPESCFCWKDRGIIFDLNHTWHIADHSPLPISAEISDVHRTRWFWRPVPGQWFAKELEHSPDCSAKRTRWCCLSSEWISIHVCGSDEWDRIVSSLREIECETRGHD